MSCLFRREMLIAGGAALLTTSRARAETIGARVGDHLRAVTDRSGGVLGPDDLSIGAAPVLAWPVDPANGRSRDGERYAQLLVFRPDPERVAAFTAVCTHAGCIVSDWNAVDRLALCPCHGSEYDLFRAGAVARGPAPLPLPQLALTVAAGRLVVASGFDAPIGGHTGRTD